MKRILGWLLDEAEREALLARYPPVYPDVVAHHVTLDGDAAADAPLPGPAQAEIVGEANDGAGVQALVVRLNGTTDRPDGSTYHITWSLDRERGREPVESNDVIRARGWRDRPATPVRLLPSEL